MSSDPHLRLRPDARIRPTGSSRGGGVAHRDGYLVEVHLMAAYLPGSDLGHIGLTIRLAAGLAATAQTHERQLPALLFTERMRSALCDAREITSQLERSLADVALATGAGLASIFVERRERMVIERVARWVEAASRERPGRMTLPLDYDRVSIERLLEETWLDNDVASGDGSGPVAIIHGALGMLTFPLAAGDQRGVLVLANFSDQRGWGEAEIEVAECVAAVYGPALGMAHKLEMLRFTYDRSPIGISLRTQGGRFIDCNQQYLTILGLTRAEAEALPAKEHAMAEGQSSDQAVQTLVAGDAIYVEHTLRFDQQEPVRRWIRVSSALIEAPGSMEALVMSTVEDVHEARMENLALSHAASHDSLTGLANRAAMVGRLRAAARKPGPLPDLLFIDLDRFKLINDSLGHVVGDQVLVRVGARIGEQAGEDNMVVRVGGDEFGVVVADGTRDETYALAERIRRSLEDPLNVDGRLISQTASIGVALGAHCAEVRELLVRADRAMYEAKLNGRNRHVVFDDAMNAEALDHAVMERALRHALDHGELTVYFQPEFSIPDRKILGAEALLRWQHPTLGVQTAGYFIDVAEKSGLVDEIGRFALREACRLFTEHVLTPNDPSLVLRVNISGREFNRPELADLVRGALDDSGLQPNQLCLEMTEMTLMDAPTVVMDTLNTLHELGVQFAIDDFGTGYSSLTYLKRFPVDALKIDQSFVDDLVSNVDSLAIVQSIIGLGEALELDVVAEGVETVEQFELLRDLGCSKGQGYLVSPAVAAEDFGRAVER